MYVFIQQRITKPLLCKIIFTGVDVFLDSFDSLKIRKAVKLYTSKIPLR